MGGTDPDTLGMADWLEVAYADMVYGPDGWVNRIELRATIDAQLARPLSELMARQAEAERETTAAAAKKARAEQLYRERMAAAGRDPQGAPLPRGMLEPGAPAPMRPPDAQRPAAWKAREEAPPS